MDVQTSYSVTLSPTTLVTVNQFEGEGHLNLYGDGQNFSLKFSLDTLATLEQIIYHLGELQTQLIANQRQSLIAQLNKLGVNSIHLLEPKPKETNCF